MIKYGHTPNRVASLEFLAEEITYLHLEEGVAIKLSTNTTYPPKLSTYEVVKKIADPDTGMVAYCLKSDNIDDPPIVTFRGTNIDPHMAEPAVGNPPRQITGMQANLAQGGMGTDCFKEGAEGYKELNKFMTTEMNDSGKKCLMTGHSLGGVLAQLATMDEGLEGMVESLTIFQAPGVDEKSFNEYYLRGSDKKLDPTKIFNSKRKKDELSRFQFKNLFGFLVVPSHVGTTKLSTMPNHLSISYNKYQELNVSMEAKDGHTAQTEFALKVGENLMDIKTDEEAMASERHLRFGSGLDTKTETTHI